MPRKLLNILGVTFGLAVAVGNTIGAGILRTPGDVASMLQTPVLFLGVWVVGALYALLGVNDWISTCASTAAISIVIGESLAALIPAVSTQATALAMVTVVLFTALLLRSTKVGGRSQEI